MDKLTAEEQVRVIALDLAVHSSEKSYLASAIIDKAEAFEKFIRNIKKDEDTQGFPTSPSDEGDPRVLSA